MSFNKLFTQKEIFNEKEIEDSNEIPCITEKFFANYNTPLTLRELTLLYLHQKSKFQNFKRHLF